MKSDTRCKDMNVKQFIKQHRVQWKELEQLASDLHKKRRLPVKTWKGSIVSTKKLHNIFHIVRPIFLKRK